MLCVGCSDSPAFTPVHAPNPWQDDYKAISGLENYAQWGTYNVHDPSCLKIGDWYYLYSTDAIYRDHPRRRGDGHRKPRGDNEKMGKPDETGKPDEMREPDRMKKPEEMTPEEKREFDRMRKRFEEEERKMAGKMGFIQVRRSRDLVNWEFVGWAFPQIPEEAVKWVRSKSDGEGAVNIWAPYIIQAGDKYRLYYCVSAFARSISYLGMAESTSPEGPWELRGCVEKTDETSEMNAIDPTVVVDAETGKWWMHYGSYFGGLYCVELNPETGLPLKEGDQGVPSARRANAKVDNIEAAEVIYNPALKRYYLFVSYDPLMTTYNVRAGRSEHPEGPYIDYFGEEMRDTVNNYPILTAPYRFEHHPGWAGTAHCGVFTTDDGRFFMVHQGRLAPDNELMDLHVRELFFTSDGWPVVSPERYAGSTPQQFRTKDMAGRWEVIRVREPKHGRQLKAGQVMGGEGRLRTQEWNLSIPISLEKDGQIGDGQGSWRFEEENQRLSLTWQGEEIKELIVFAGHDWENETETILFTGLDANGRSVWGKRVE
ncbi:MAG: arabinan endo-1,5-alpha-L-arabinosidase [Prevotellaceae bacterium]|nr:arabinan endo-1,5-alpha-L-arabinosidase [Prevotellaceae bacterium]